MSRPESNSLRSTFGLLFNTQRDLDMFESCQRFTYAVGGHLKVGVPERESFADVFKNFRGSTIFVDENNKRTELPFKKPDEPVPVWKIISKFIG